MDKFYLGEENKVLINNASGGLGESQLFLEQVGDFSDISQKNRFPEIIIDFKHGSDRKVSIHLKSDRLIKMTRSPKTNFNQSALDPRDLNNENSFVKYARYVGPATIEIDSEEGKKTIEGDSLWEYADNGEK
jgi:hypothetical protein